MECESEDCANMALYEDGKGYVVCEECMENDIHEDGADYKDFTEIK